MVISDEYSYLFIELPFTASTAISKELREQYAGRSILGKHSTYREFLKYASPEQQSYFVFSGIRNPMDEAVSLYVKYCTNPYDHYTDPEWWVTRRMIRRFKWVQRREATFAEFLRRFYWLPYENWSSLDHHRFDFIYRLEQVAADFRTILSEIGIPQLRELPMVHPTRGKDRWRSHYTPDTHRRARWVFGPFMERWDYQFPADWPRDSVPRMAHLVFDVEKQVKNRLRILRGFRSRYSQDRLP